MKANLSCRSCSRSRLCLLTKHSGHTGCLQAHQIWKLIDDDVSAGLYLVNPFNASPLPVSPVDVISQQGESKYMWKFILQEGSPHCSINIYDLWDTGDNKKGKIISSAVAPIQMAELAARDSSALCNSQHPSGNGRFLWLCQETEVLG